MSVRVTQSPRAPADAPGPKQSWAEEGLKPDTKSVKKPNPNANVEPPVDSYKDEREVPAEFLIRPPFQKPGRCWGDDDESKLVQVPLVDLAPFLAVRVDQVQSEYSEGEKRVITEIGRACETWGIFEVTNHGIPENMLDRVLDVTNEFFEMPLEDRREYSLRPGESEGYGRLDCTTPGDTTRARFWNDSMRHKIRPRRPVEEERIPDKPASYRSVMDHFAQGLEGITRVVWVALSEYLGLGPSALRDAQRAEDEEVILLRLNYYPKCAEPEKVLGVGGHKDFGSLTVFLQDEVGGLQIQKPDSPNLWMDVNPSKKGSLIIHIANQAEILSNGRYHSVLHRALVNRDRSRVSIAAFVNPGLKSIIAPVKELLEKTQQLPRYKELLYGDYYENFMSDVKARIPAHLRYEINRG